MGALLFWSMRPDATLDPWSLHDVATAFVFAHTTRRIHPEGCAAAAALPQPAAAVATLLLPAAAASGRLGQVFAASVGGPAATYYPAHCRNAPAEV